MELVAPLSPGIPAGVSGAHEPLQNQAGGILEELHSPDLWKLGWLQVQLHSHSWCLHEISSLNSWKGQGPCAPFWKRLQWNWLCFSYRCDLSFRKRWTTALPINVNGTGVNTPHIWQSDQYCVCVAVKQVTRYCLSHVIYWFFLPLFFEGSIKSGCCWPLLFVYCWVILANMCFSALDLLIMNINPLSL